MVASSSGVVPLQQMAAAKDASVIKAKQEIGGGVRPAAEALSQLTATLREAKRGSHFTGKGEKQFQI